MRIILIYIILSISLYATPKSIENYIKKSGLKKSEVSIYIKEVGRGGGVVASVNSDTMRIPASVIKVLSTYASVLKLGFNYRWETRFYTTGKIRNGVLYGHLIIKGFGDPTLDDADLKRIVSRIKSNGIREIKGSIVIDRSYFNVGNRDNSGFDKNIYSAYNAMPDAMMFNERISTVYLNPKNNTTRRKNNDRSYRVVNNLKIVNKPCRGRYSWPGVKISKSKSIPTMILQGKISKRCGRQTISKVITKPYKSFYYALKSKLKQKGINVTGGLKLTKVPSSAKLLFTHYANTLEDIVSVTSKKSNNLYARHLMLLLGAKVYGAPATVSKGRKAINYILNINGALSRYMPKIDNGCGLSRKSKISAKMLSDILDNAYERYGQRWLNTLSIGGVDGTIKRRFRGTVVKNRAWMKTGTVNRVKNISGYVKDKSGRLYTVVILVNSPKSRYNGSLLQNNIIKWLVKNPQAVKKTNNTTELFEDDNYIF